MPIRACSFSAFWMNLEWVGSKLEHIEIIFWRGLEKVGKQVTAGRRSNILKTNRH